MQQAKGQSPGSTLSLPQIAERMTQQAATVPTGAVYHVLGRGLHVVYSRMEGAVRLAIGREAPSTPSAQELAIVAKAFHAPEGAESSEKIKGWCNPTTKRKVLFNVLELRWREVTHATG
jgi:hypothetical protein